ncbi:MAG: Prolipoprotein diacylglyceryl transferase [Elusimicrobia bacterium ADurb.Bin231]|nr:MAG: Prolipoprotein diacylglyceryl transferase [Elusimicrobia bacterium ADurb.Bin231]
MHPLLLQIGFLKIHTYGVFVAIAFFVSYKILIRYASGIGVEREKMETMVFWTFIISILGARIHYVLYFLKDFIASPLEIFKIWNGGLVFFGGFIGGLTGAVYFIRKYGLRFDQMSDILAIALSIGQAIGRLGCFFAGCCYGTRCSGIFCVVFPEDSLAPHGVELFPVQILSSLLLFAIFWFLRYLYPKQKVSGRICAMYLMLYGIKRFFVEFLRGDFRGRYIWGLTVTQMAAICMFLAGIVLWIKLFANKTESV